MTKRKWIIVLTLVCISFIGLFLYFFNKPVFVLENDIHVEINESFDLKNYIKQSRGYSTDDLSVDNSQVDTGKLGKYTVNYLLKNQSYSTTVTVADTTAPVVKGKDASVDMNTDVDPNICIESIDDATSCTVTFKEEYDFSKVDAIPVTIVVKDEGDNITEISQTIDIFEDTTAPVLENIDTVTVYTGTKINFKKNVKVKDDHDSNPSYTVDTSKVNIYYPGEYTAIYTTKDQYNNTAEYKRKVIVKKRVTPVTVSTNTDKVVYLTFDDGPSANTVKILNILDSYNAKATFFVTGNGQSYNSSIVDAHNRGNTIALHTYKHNYAIYQSVDTYLADLNQVGDMVEGLIGYRPHYIRFPGGSSNTVSKKYSTGIMTTLTQEVTTLGYRYYDWNASSGDAEATTVSTDKIIKNATSYSQNNIMLLFHDSSSKTTTVDALPAIIEYYQSKGYVFKAIDDNTFTPHHPVAN